VEFGAEFVEFTLFLSGEEAGVASSLVFGGHGGSLGWMVAPMICLIMG